MRKKIIASCLSAGVLMLSPLAVQAAGLGKLSVKSALGQPLNAEIELLATDKAELAALTARMAGSDAFRNAKIEPAAALSSLKFTVEKKADGRPVLKITSSNPINDPFLDMLIELDWATGRMVREYTVLLDPPGSTDLKPTSPLGVTAATAGASGSAKNAGIINETRPAAGVPSADKLAGARAQTKLVKTESTASQTYGPVKRGDTLGAIARNNQLDGVNLEQMLIGIYRENRKAFDGNNINRLKTGQILKLPDQQQVAAIAPSEAAREIKLQAADWESYRQKLAGEVAKSVAAPAASTQAAGKIMPKVEDKAGQGQTGKDVLKLSKGEAPAAGRTSTGKEGKAAVASQDKINALEEDTIAKQNALKEANSRVAALEKNIQDMQRLLEIKNQALAELQKNATGKPVNGVAPAAPATAVAPALKPAEADKPAVEAVKPAEVAKPVDAVKPVAPTKPVVTPAAVAATPAATPETEKWYQNINPLYLGGAALAVLLAALLGFMMRGKRRRQGLSSFEDSIMTGSDLKASTIYGTQGGAAVNTNNNTSFLTDFSQAGLGTIDTHDVDPIAEAEVYMAYGRDAQAEEILKEALTKDPARHEIHLKLLEIYAARKNLPAFESIATELYAGLGGEMTPLWAKAADLGRKLDPNNPLYAETAGAGGGAVSHAAPVADGTHTAAASVVAAAGMATVALASRRQSDAAVDDPGTHATEADPLDHALDFGSVASSGQSGFDGEINQQGIIAEAVEKHATHDDSIFHDLDTLMAESNTESGFAGFDVPAPQEKQMTAEPAIQQSTEHADDGLDFDFDFPEAAPDTAVSSAAPVLDFSDISLDLNDIGDMGDTHSIAENHDEHADSWHEVATKLDLARVYQEMGDTDNAREILREVVQEGDATQKAEAQVLLDQLG